jgi:hypothetical protein
MVYSKDILQELGWQPLMENGKKTIAGFMYKVTKSDV